MVWLAFLFLVDLCFYLFLAQLIILIDSHNWTSPLITEDSETSRPKILAQNVVETLGFLGTS